MPWYGNQVAASKVLDNLRSAERPLQIIVVDDHHPVPFETRDERITVVRRPTNGGFGHAENTGIKIAQNPLLMILNSDLIIHEDFVDTFAEKLQGLGMGIASPWWAHPQGMHPPYYPAGRFPCFHGEVLSWLTPLARFHDSTWYRKAVGIVDEPVPGGLHQVDWFVGAAIGMPTSVALALDGFDEDFYMFSEETDLMFRARHILGVRSWIVPDVWMAHEGGASTPSMSRQIWQAQARLVYAEKRRLQGFPGGHAGLRIALTAASVINVLWNAARWIMGREATPWKTFRHEMSRIWISLPRPR